jgi:hypothetical protein
MSFLARLRAWWQGPAPEAKAVLPHQVISVKPDPRPSGVVPAGEIVANHDLSVKAATARGYRNRNPGNIDWSASNPWQGQTGRETMMNGQPGRFATFDTHENGIRAMARLLMNYDRIYELDTVTKIVGRWAPKVENDTAAYASRVARLMNRSADQRLNLTMFADLRPLVEAMIVVELGGQPYPDEVIDEGVRRALAG